MAASKKIVEKMSPFAITLTIVVLGIVFYLSGVDFLDLMEHKTVDLRFLSRGVKEVKSDVVLAVIDEKSLEKEGKWIWPRWKIADMVQKLSDAGARVIAFDITFIEPDQQGVLKALDDVKMKYRQGALSDRNFEAYLQELRGRSDYDRMLADAIRNSKAKVVLGYFFHMNEEDLGHKISKEEFERHAENIRNTSYSAIRFAPGAPSIAEMNVYQAFVPASNIDIISESTPHAGYFNMAPESDGVVRKLMGMIRFNDNLYPALSIQALSAYIDAEPTIRVEEWGVESIQIGDITIPTDESGRILVNYRGPRQTVKHISVTDILQDKVPPEDLKGKIVMVGATAVGIYDLRVTPFDEVFPGLEIHANLVDSVLTRDFLFQPGWSKIFDIMAILVSGLFVGFVVMRTRILFGALSGFAFFGGYILLCQYFFTHTGLILNLVYPLSVTVFVFVGIILYRYIVEEGQKRFIKSAFSTYLSPAVVNQLIESPEKLKLGGERREITAFFSDLQGFTTISEKLTPEALVELLNDYLTQMTDTILDLKGMVDKYEGDAIIAIFGAPNELPNHGETGVIACLTMQKQMEELRARYRAENRPELKMRIGLYSGPAVVGNMGSRNRMDYTMMGNTVNTAARLEGVNKIYGTYTMIGDTTYQMAKDKIVARELDSILVVGKQEPVPVYQPLCLREEADPRTTQLVAHYENGLREYRKRNWDQAIGWFKAVLAIDPEDGPGKTMVKRCEAYKENPPPEGWNGAFTMTSK